MLINVTCSPGVAAGLNVDSPMLDRLAEHKNIVGVKVRSVTQYFGLAS
jgi:hypothetical protein